MLQDVKVGNLVTDIFSKTGLVEKIDISDDGLYKIYEFNMVTGRTITIKKYGLIFFSDRDMEFSSVHGKGNGEDSLC